MTKKIEYLTKETAYPIIARYYKSGGGIPSAFYKKEGLSESQFYTWRKRYLKDHPTAAAPSGKPASFHPIQVSASKQLETKGQIELEYPNGVILRMDSIPEESALSSLIKLY